MDTGNGSLLYYPVIYRCMLLRLGTISDGMCERQRSLVFLQLWRILDVVDKFWRTCVGWGMLLPIRSIPERVRAERFHLLLQRLWCNVDIEWCGERRVARYLLRLNGAVSIMYRFDRKNMVLYQLWSVMDGQYLGNRHMGQTAHVAIWPVFHCQCQ